MAMPKERGPGGRTSRQRAFFARVRRCADHAGLANQDTLIAVCQVCLARIVVVPGAWRQTCANGHTWSSDDVRPETMVDDEHVLDVLLELWEREGHNPVSRESMRTALMHSRGRSWVQQVVDPTPEEIRTRAAELRANWGPRDSRRAIEPTVGFTEMPDDVVRRCYR